MPLKRLLATGQLKRVMALVPTGSTRGLPLGERNLLVRTQIQQTVAGNAGRMQVHLDLGALHILLGADAVILPLFFLLLQGGQARTLQ